MVINTKTQTNGIETKCRSFKKFVSKGNGKMVLVQKQVKWGKARSLRSTKSTEDDDHFYHFSSTVQEI